MTGTPDQANINGFLQALAEVSYRHGLAIGDGGEVFVLDKDDYSFTYSLTDGDYLLFGA